MIGGGVGLPDFVVCSSEVNSEPRAIRTLIRIVISDLVVSI